MFNIVEGSNGPLALDGADATGVTPPTGASGIRGWLSSIYNMFNLGLALSRNIAAASQINIASSISSRTSGSGVSSASATTGISVYRSALVVLTISSSGTASSGSPTLTLIIQGSADGGGTWVDLAAFDTIATADSTSLIRQIRLSEYGTPASPTTKTGSGSMTALGFNSGPWGDRLRIYEIVAGGTSYSSAPVYTINALFKS